MSSEAAVLGVVTAIAGAAVALIAEHTVFRDKPSIAVGTEQVLLCKPFDGVKKQTLDSRFSSLRSTSRTIEVECNDGSTVRRSYWE